MLPMSDRTTGLLYVGVMVLLSFAFQYQMKILAGEVAPALSRTIGVADKVQGVLRDLQPWRLVLVLGLATLLFAVWFLALTKLDLSVALPLASVALVVNAVGSGLLLGESLGLLRIGGVIVVAIGIAMVLKS
jgi:drug/metabolite transporter (DMT)-like permease